MTPKQRDIGVKITSMNCIPGDVVEWIDDEESDESTERRCKVQIRGSWGQDVVLVSLQDVSPLPVDSEELRQALVRKSSKGEPRLFLQSRLLAMNLQDEIGYLINKHTDTENSVDPLLPRCVSCQVLARVIESYYIGLGRVRVDCWHFSSYAHTLSPFLTVESVGRPGTPASFVIRSSAFFDCNSGDLLKKLCNMFHQAPDESGALLMKVMAFSQYQIDSTMAKEGKIRSPPVAALVMVFTSIHLMHGHEHLLRGISCQRILASVDAFFKDYGIDLGSKLRHYKLPTAAKCGDTCNRNHLIWCLCIQCLRLAHMAKLHLRITEFENLLPHPFANMTNELQGVINIMFTYRPHSPQTFLAGYGWLMSVLDDVQPAVRYGWLQNAHRLLKTGIQAANVNGDPFYMYTFAMLDLLWIPTTFTALADTLTGREIKEQMSQAKAWKRECEGFLPDSDFALAKAAEYKLKSYLQTFKIDNDHKVFQFPDTYAYFQCWFTSSENRHKYYAKYEQLVDQTKYHCANCGTHVLQSKKCSYCREKNYCSRECQVKHWRKGGHKQACSRRYQKG